MAGIYLNKRDWSASFVELNKKKHQRFVDHIGRGMVVFIVPLLLLNYHSTIIDRYILKTTIYRDIQKVFFSDFSKQIV